jgi:hypothetical protein
MNLCKCCTIGILVFLCVGGLFPSAWSQVENDAAVAQIPPISNIIVSAKMSKPVYNYGEPVWVEVEVENNNDYQIVPKVFPSGYWAGDLSTRNISFDLYRNECEITGCFATLEGKGILRSVLYEPKGGTSALVPVLPHSKAVVGVGDLFERVSVAPGPPNFGRGQFVARIRFVGKRGTAEVVGWAVVTFRVE